MKSTDFAPWAWKSWVRWNALAILLVELCSQPPGESYDAAYSIASQSFSHYSSLIADTETGMLWKPITKLMRRLQQHRYSNGVSETSTLVNGLDVDKSMRFTTPDFTMPNYGLDFDSHAENMYNSQGDQTMMMNGDAQVNWFTFTDSINMGYPFDWENELL